MICSIFVHASNLGVQVDFGMASRTFLIWLLLGVCVCVRDNDTDDGPR